MSRVAESRPSSARPPGELPHGVPNARLTQLRPGTDDARRVPWPHFVRGTLRDGRFEITEASESLKDLVGHPGDALHGPEPWIRLIPADEAAHVKELIARTAAGESWSDRLRLITPPNGREAVFDVHANTRSQPDGSIGVRVSLRDISELATALTALGERDARLFMLMAEVPVILWSCGYDLRISWLSVSPLVSEHPPEGELIDRPIHELFGIAETDRPRAAEEAALRGERAAYEIVARGHRFRCSVEPQFDLFGKIIGTIGTGVSIDGAPPGDSGHRARLRPRRVPAEPQRDGASEVIQLVDLFIEPENFVASKRGRELPLTVTEFRLLMEFATHPGRVLSRDDLVRSVWGYEFTGSTGMVTMAVKRLRAKIEDDPTHPKIIETVRGVGYRVHGLSANGDQRPSD